MFDETNLGLVFQIDTFVASEILDMLFDPKITQALETFKSDSIHLISDFGEGAESTRITHPKKSKLKETEKLFVNSVGNCLQSQMLTLIYYCAHKKEAYHNMLYYLLATFVVQRQLKIPLTIVKEALFYIIKFPKNVPVWENYNKKVQTKEPQDNLRNEERSALILELLRSLEGEISSEDLEKIKQLIDNINL